MESIIKERIFWSLRRNIALYFYADPYAGLKDLYLTDPGCCTIPEEYVGDDLNKNIYDKFYAVLDAIRREVCGEGIDIFIDVSTESESVLLMTSGKTILYKEHVKAWGFWWESLEDFERYIHTVYTEIATYLAQMELESAVDLPHAPGTREVKFEASYIIADAESDEEAIEQAEEMLRSGFEQCSFGISELFDVKVTNRGDDKLTDNLKGS
jgi:hypothetical protein